MSPADPVSPPPPALVARLRAAGCVFAEEEATELAGVAAGEALETLVTRRVAGEPLEHLVGHVDFDGHRFRLAAGVFIPRQRSTLLVEEAARIGGTTILDLCCGCGALGLAVRARIGGDLHAADLDPEAVACARDNGVGSSYVGDLYDALPADLRGRVDLLLVNAPYVPSPAIDAMPAESRLHEPRTAVDGGPDGMDVQRRVLAGAPAWLAPGGHLLTETSTVQVERLAGLAREAGLDPRVVRDDERGATVLVASIR